MEIDQFRGVTHSTRGLPQRQYWQVEQIEAAAQNCNMHSSSRVEADRHRLGKI